MRDINNKTSAPEKYTYNEFLNKYQRNVINNNNNGNGSSIVTKSNNSSSSSLNSTSSNSNQVSYTSYQDYLKKYETKKFGSVKPIENNDFNQNVASAENNTIVNSNKYSMPVQIQPAKNVKSELIIQLTPSDPKPHIFAAKPVLNLNVTLPRNRSFNSITTSSPPPPPPPPLPSSYQLNSKPPVEIPNFVTLPRNNRRLNTSPNVKPKPTSPIDLLLDELKSKTKRYDPPDTPSPPAPIVNNHNNHNHKSTPPTLPLIKTNTLPPPQRRAISNQLKVNQNVNKVTNQEARVTTVIQVSDDNVDSMVKNDANVKKLVYNTYRGFLGAYNNKANDMISNSTGVIVKENRGVNKQLQSLA